MKKPTTTHNYPLLIFLVIMLVIFIWFCSFVIETAKIEAVEGSQKSECQYPLRTTNPPDGCDNSDPCDPANVAKGGSGDCITPVSERDDDIPKRPETVEKPVDTVGNSCGS